MLNLADEAFNQMPLPVQVLIILSLLKAILFWWNHGFNALGCERFDQRIRIVAFVSDQHLWVKAFDQRRCLWTVVALACGQDKAQRIAQSINCDMNLSREAATTSS